MLSLELPMLCKMFTVRALDLGKSLGGCIFGNLVPLFFLNFHLTLFFSDEKKVGPWLWRWRSCEDDTDTAARQDRFP